MKPKPFSALKNFTVPVANGSFPSVGASLRGTHLLTVAPERCRSRGGSSARGRTISPGPVEWVFTRLGWDASCAGTPVPALDFDASSEPLPEERAVSVRVHRMPSDRIAALCL